MNYDRLTVWDLLAWLFLGRYRNRMEDIADDVVAEVVKAFKHVDYDNLDDTQLAFLDTALPQVQQRFEEAQRETGQFLQEYRQLYVASRALEAPPRDLVVPAEDTVNAQRALEARQALRELPRGRSPERPPALRSAPAFDPPRAAMQLAAAGPGTVKKARGVPPKDAMARGAKDAAGAAVRIVLNGARDAVVDEAEQDSYAMGWQRVTDNDPCYFCALLAANGPFYSSPNAFKRSDKKFIANEQFADVGEPEDIAKVHNHCRCTLVPVFEGFEQEDPWGNVALRIWNKVTDNGLSGKEALSAYRRAFDENLKDSDPLSGDAIDSQAVLDKINRTLRGIRSDSPAAEYLRDQANRFRRAA